MHGRMGVLLNDRLKNYCTDGWEDYGWNDAEWMDIKLDKVVPSTFLMTSSCESAKQHWTETLPSVV